MEDKRGDKSKIGEIMLSIWFGNQADEAFSEAWHSKAANVHFDSLCSIKSKETLWTGGPGIYTNPDAPTALSEIRKLVNDRKYVEATVEGLKLGGSRTEAYQLLGDIKLDFDASHAAYIKETYQRELDLNTATAKVQYYVGEVEFTREHFASNPDQVIVTKISASKPRSLSFTVSLDSQLDHHSYVSGTSQIILEGSCPHQRIILPKANDNPKGIKFSAVLDLQISDGVGAIRVLDGGKLGVEGSDWAVLLLVASSSFDGPFTKPENSRKNPTSEALNTMKAVRNLSYTELYSRHVADYQSLFSRVSLQLFKGSKVIGIHEMKKTLHRGTGFCLKGIGDTVPTPERIKSFQVDEDPALVALLFQYGRYLLISSSRPGTQVANLQGIWNKDLAPQWESSPTLNINTEMNYWPSLPCNLHECLEPLVDYLSVLSINGKNTAQVNYGASGWVTHHRSDIWAKTSPLNGDAVYCLWPMGGAWLCTHLWEHYSYTMDKGFLEGRAYPLMEGCTAFLLDWLIEGPGGYLETNPSTSPEHEFLFNGQRASVSYSSTMDMSIIREVFSAIVSAAEVLGKGNDDLIERVRKAQPRLYPIHITKDGCIMEWAEDFEVADVTHRHLSHLFGLYPGHTITLERTPDLCKAAASSLIKRGENGPGWSTSWKIALWSRLHNDENAYRMVKHLFKPADPDQKVGFTGGLYNNLFAAHPPFQIDGNFGFTAAVAEILVQSTMKDLYLLPALPRDKWPSGCVKGLKARGGVTVDICWDEGDLREVSLWSVNQESVKRVCYRGITAAVKISSGLVYTLDRQLKCVMMSSL